MRTTTDVTTQTLACPCTNCFGGCEMCAGTGSGAGPLPDVLHITISGNTWVKRAGDSNDHPWIDELNPGTQLLFNEVTNQFDIAASCPTPPPYDSPPSTGGLLDPISFRLVWDPNWTNRDVSGLGLGNGAWVYKQYGGGGYVYGSNYSAFIIKLVCVNVGVEETPSLKCYISWYTDETGFSGTGTGTGTSPGTGEGDPVGAPYARISSITTVGTKSGFRWPDQKDVTYANECNPPFFKFPDPGSAPPLSSPIFNAETSNGAPDQHFSGNYIGAPGTGIEPLNFYTGAYALLSATVTA